MLIKQQILPIQFPQEKSFDNFLVGSNTFIVKNLTELTPKSSLYLWGNPGSGCSHLLKASCAYWQKKGWYSLYLDVSQKGLLEELLAGTLDGIQLLAIDHLDGALGNKHQEELLFHIANRSMQTPFAVLWSAQCPPKLLHCVLPDFASRLSASLVLQVHTLNEHEMQQALQQHAQQRGLTLNDEVAQYLLTHYPRDLTQLIELLDQLDQISLETKRRLTIPLLKTFLNQE